MVLMHTQQRVHVPDCENKVCDWLTTRGAVHFVGVNNNHDEFKRTHKVTWNSYYCPIFLLIIVTLCCY